MTDREKAIVMAYTGACMLNGDKFNIFHKYIEDIMGRPVYTHEMAFLENEIKERSKNDFVKLCKEENMSNFIKLTSQYGGDVFVNVDKIICIDDDKENEKIIGSRLTLSDGRGVFVNETMDEILDKIKGE